jgi:UDP-N-acetylmuramoyl-L-alanyl-D-glutamate--2,6-diaminopimelate ligase
VETPLVARYNVSNCLAAIMVGYLRGVAPEITARALATFPGMSGRMERVEAGQPYMVVVDYAHSADNLEKALSVLRPPAIVVVFGSAGDVALLAGKGHEQNIFVGKERLSGTILPSLTRRLP